MLTCFIHNWEYYYAISVKFCRKVHAEWHGLCLLDYEKKKKKKDNELERIWQLLYRKQKACMNVFWMECFMREIGNASCSFLVLFLLYKGSFKLSPQVIKLEQ